MRKEGSVEIDGKTIIVYEIQVSQMGKMLLVVDSFLAALKSVQSADDVELAANIANMLAGNWDTVVGILDGCTSLGKEIREYGGSDFIAVMEKFMEVNESFFGKIQTLMTQEAPPAKKRKK